ncbi:MAG: hypothetical protein ACK4NE_00010 [Albidovulum sp.]
MAEWFRLWHGAPTDPKWRTVARRASVRPGDVWAVVSCLMDRASQSEDRGSVVGYDVEVIADALGFETDDVERIIAALCDKAVISEGRIKAWEKYQPKREDHSSDRVAAFRERQKTERNAVKRDETQSNPRGEEIRVEEKDSPRSPPLASFEVRCREVFGEEAIVGAPDFTPITSLLAEGVVTEVDVLTGCAAAMADPSFRPRYWRQIVGWARAAHRDRISGKPKHVRPRDAPTEKQPPSDDAWRLVMRRWFTEGIWHQAFGPEGGADCPAHIKAEFERAA